MNLVKADLKDFRCQDVYRSKFEGQQRQIRAFKLSFNPGKL